LPRPVLEITSYDTKVRIKDQEKMHSSQGRRRRNPKQRKRISIVHIRSTSTSMGRRSKSPRTPAHFIKIRTRAKKPVYWWKLTKMSHQRLVIFIVTIFSTPNMKKAMLPTSILNQFKIKSIRTTEYYHRNCIHKNLSKGEDKLFNIGQQF
jgi:hypothetical protein